MKSHNREEKKKRVRKEEIEEERGRLCTAACKREC